MTVEQLGRTLGLRQVAGGTERLAEDVSGCYAGDLLSWVMVKASPGNAWITVMGVLNSVAVAVMGGLSCILLAENAPLDRDAAERADKEGVPVFVSELAAAELAEKVICALREGTGFL